MSADNWAICPKCLAEAKSAAEKQTREVYAKYGSVPIEEFDRLRDALSKVDPEDHRTFREDYEFYGAEEGVAHADYSGHCSECGLGLDFNVERKFWPLDTT